MSDVEGIKSFIYAFLQKNHHKTPEYIFQQKAAGRGRLRFICELRVDGFSYVGVGNSVNKKDSQTNAARDFANYLIRDGFINEREVPKMRAEEYSRQIEDDIKPESSSSSYPPAPQDPGTNSRSDFESEHPRGPRDSYINRIMDQKRLEEAEEVDLTADIHGGWSMENAKARLNEYLQTTRQQPVNIKYMAIGPDHNRSFLAEATMLAKRVNKPLYAREGGSNKVMASRACCLSLVRQLFHVDEIEAFSGVRRKKRSDEIPPIIVELDPDLEHRLHVLLDKLHMLPRLAPPPGVEEHNLIINYKIADFEPQPRQCPQIVSWCPPASNWNPWTACNIDEGPEAMMSLAEISRTHGEQYRRRLQSPGYKNIRVERDALPAATFRDRILETISQNQVTLIRGETGCGKTTQIPQFILDSYLASSRGAECCILVTQPRRICAISLAERIASERCESSVGTSVGYSVRFETILPRPHGSILFCTVGTLCRKMESGVRGISHIIIDEIHERDVNTDFMLILVRDLVRVNRDLRLILMSATIDTTTFSDYFGNCAIVELEGRTHPVTYYYLEDCLTMTNYIPPPNEDRVKKAKRPRPEEVDEEDNCNLVCPEGYSQVVAAVMRDMPEKEISFGLVASLLDHICEMDIEGAVLIFLPGWNTISMLKKFLQAHPRYSNAAKFLILPLHSQVPREDQRLVFRPVAPGLRKIVLSTNIAESSITINDVVFVIDACLARVKMFTARNNLTSYSTVWASRTNLEQRRGRAGRVRPGFAFHLCSQARLARLDDYTTPEILRTPLHELALMIKLLRLGDISTFLKKAIQPPPIDAVVEAEYTLREMKALDCNDELTPLGRILARLPIEPRLGRMLVFACAFRLGGAMALLAAHSSFGSDVFSVPPDRRRLSWDQIRFAAGSNSDHLAALNVFQVWSAEVQHGGDQAAAYLCDLRELNGSSLRMIEDAASQIRSILVGLDFPESVLYDPPIDFYGRACPTYDYVGAMLTSGLYPNIAYHVEKRKVLTAEGRCALVHKGSVNCIKNPNFPFPLFTFTEKIRTQAISCKSLTMITPIQLLLFGCRRGVWRPTTPGNLESSLPETGIILLDDWLPFRMHYATAVRIFALRPALEALLVRICLQPDVLVSLSPEDEAVIGITKALCERRALRSALAEDVAGNSCYIRRVGSGASQFNVSADFDRPVLGGGKRYAEPNIDTMTPNPYEARGRGRVGYRGGDAAGEFGHRGGGSAYRRRYDENPGYSGSGEYRSWNPNPAYQGENQEYPLYRGPMPAIKRDYSTFQGQQTGYHATNSQRQSDSYACNSYSQPAVYYNSNSQPSQTYEDYYATEPPQHDGHYQYVNRPPTQCPPFPPSGYFDDKHPQYPPYH